MRTLTCLLLAVVALPAAAQERKSGIPLLTVVGTAEVRAAPDEAMVRLGVVAQAPTAQAAQQAANAIAQRFLERLREMNVAREHVQTSQVTLTPVYTRPRPSDPEPPAIVAYRAQNTLAVRLQDLSLIGRVIDAGVQAGANNLEGVQFGLRDDGPARLRALREAVAEGREKARAMAEALGVRLGPLHEADEGLVRIPPLQMMGRGAEVAGAPTPVEPGQISVAGSVTLRYRIVERPGR